MTQAKRDVDRWINLAIEPVYHIIPHYVSNHARLISGWLSSSISNDFFLNSSSDRRFSGASLKEYRVKESSHGAIFALLVSCNFILPVGNCSCMLRQVKIGCMSIIDFVPLGRMPLHDTPLGNMQSIHEDT